MVGSVLVRGAIVVTATAMGTAPARAEPSVVGGRTLGGRSAHQIWLGLPSLGYQYWEGGATDFAIGGELVYGEWSGGHADVEAGLAGHVTWRRPIRRFRKLELAWALSPGVLLGAIERGRDEDGLLGARVGLELQAGIPVDRHVTIVTGGMTLPTLYVFEGGPAAEVPVYGRIGVEGHPTEGVNVWMTIALGPALAITEDDTDMDSGALAFLGVTLLP